jgi:hypothetical protein
VRKPTVTCSGQAIIAPIDVNQWRRAAGSRAAERLTELLVDRPDLAAEEATTKHQEGASGAPALRESLLNASAGLPRRRMMEGRLQLHLARVLLMPIARFDHRGPFKEMGLDSLTALELRSHLEKDTGLRLSATVFWSHPTISALATELAGKMGVPLDADDDSHEPEDGEAELRRLLDELERLPQDEARRLLTEEFAMEEAR